MLPQSVYYVYAYVKLAKVAQGEPIVFCVPSGNFGDMMGAIIAKRIGLPIERLVIATNENDEVPKYLETGVYGKIQPSRVCISNAMNVGHPSNLARLVDAYGGWMDEVGGVKQPPDMAAMRRDLYAISINDQQTRATIKSAYEKYKTVLEPHGAVGWAGLETYLAQRGDEPLSVSVETAHPAKFPEEIQALLGIDPVVPPALQGMEDKPEHWEHLPVQYEPFKAMLLEKYGKR